MTIYEKLRQIKEQHFHELHRENERQFIEDMYDGIQGLGEIDDIEIADYLTERQIKWIEDIAVALGIET